MASGARPSWGPPRARLCRTTCVPDRRRLFGDRGEAAAARLLEGRGLRVVARNARTRYGELDLVCRDARGYVFVEVKTRRAGASVPAIEALDGRKVARLQRLAEAWLALVGQRDAPSRLALLALTVAGDTARAELVEIS